MYQLWLPTAHDFLFIIKNDVLVPNGVLDRLMRTMDDAGASIRGVRSLENFVREFRSYNLIPWSKHSFPDSYAIFMTPISV